MKILTHNGLSLNRRNAITGAVWCSLIVGGCGDSVATGGGSATSSNAETSTTDIGSSETSLPDSIANPCPASGAVHTIQVTNGGEVMEWPYVVYSWVQGDCSGAVNILLFPDSARLDAAVQSGDFQAADSYLEITFYDPAYTSSEKWTVPATLILKRPGGGGGCDGEVTVAHYEPLSYGGAGKPWPFLVGSVDCLSGDLHVLGGFAAPLCEPLVRSC